ncbi:MAG: hypothetical protein R8M38_01875 [Mariprofundaceae bacterium]
MLAWLAWYAWNPPMIQNDYGVHILVPKLSQQSQSKKVNVQSNSPARPQKAPELWYVVTRKQAWKQAANMLKARLIDEGLRPVLISNHEPMTLNAFDDPRYFSHRKAAMAAKNAWEQVDIEADVLKSGDGFRIGLGRFYLNHYAKRIKAQLDKIGAPYQYERREMMIATYRFTFAAMKKRQAEALWREVQSLGIAEPVLMDEQQFFTMFAHLQVQPAQE